MFANSQKRLNHLRRHTVKQLHGLTTTRVFFGVSSSESDRSGEAGFDICPSTVSRCTKRKRHNGNTNPDMLREKRTCRILERFDMRIAREKNLNSSSRPKTKIHFNFKMLYFMEMLN